MGHGCSFQGVSSRIHRPSSSYVIGKGHPTPRKSGQKGYSSRRSVKTGAKRGYSQNLSSLRSGFLVDLLPCTQKDRRLEAYHQPQTSQPIYKTKEIQNGKPCNHTSVSNKRKMGYIHRPKGRLPPHPYRTSSPKMVEIQDRGAGVPVQRPPIRPQHLSSRVYKSCQSSKCPSETGRNSDLHVSRRLDHSSVLPDAGFGEHSTCSERGPSSRVYRQCRQVESRPVSEAYLPGGSPRSGFGGGTSHVGQDSQPERVCDVPSRSELSSGGGVVEGVRSHGKHDRTRPVVSSAHETSPASSSLPLQHSPSASFDVHSSVGHHQERAQMVGEHRQSPRGDAIPETVSGHSPHHGRVGDRVGRSPGGAVSKRHMVRSGTGSSHQYAGIMGSSQLYPSIQGRMCGATGSGKIRQHDCSSQYMQTRRNEVPIAMPPHATPTPLVCSIPNNPNCHSHPGTRQYAGGQSIEGPNIGDSTHRVVPVPHSVPQTAGHGAIRIDRSVRQQRESSTPSLLLQIHGSDSLRNGRIQHPVDGHGGVCIPTYQPHQQGPQQNQGGGLFDFTNRPVVAQASLVHRCSRSPDRETNRLTSGSRPSLDAGLVSNVLRSKNPEADGLAIIRDRYEKAGFSRPVADMVARGRRSSTRRIYTSRLRPYLQWCEDKATDPSYTSVNQVAEFLLHMFDTGLQTSTVKGYLAAINSIHSGTINGESLSGNREIKLLFEGMNNSRPAPRRKWPSWNIQIVLKYLRGPQFEPPHKATLRNMSIKALFLLAVASGRRCSELHALTVGGGIVFSNAGATLYFAPGFLAKNELSSFSASPIFIPYLNKGKGRAQRLNCPVRALLWYVHRTRLIRGSEISLFISSKRPHKRVAKTTLANWLVDVIIKSKAVKDDQLPRAHSVRALSSSCAAAKGISVADIVQTVSWRTSTTFVTTYLSKDVTRISAGGRYAGSVLSQ